MPTPKNKLKMTISEEPGALVQAATAIGAALGNATKKVAIVVGRYEPTVAAVKKRLPRKVKKLAKQTAAKKAAARVNASK